MEIEYTSMQELPLGVDEIVEEQTTRLEVLCHGGILQNGNEDNGLFKNLKRNEEGGEEEFLSEEETESREGEGEEEIFIQSSNLESENETSANVADEDLLRSVTDEIWTEEKILDFIRLRCEKDAEIYSSNLQTVYKQILEELGISDKVTASQARSKWSILTKCYLKIENAEESAAKTSSLTPAPDDEIQNSPKVIPRPFFYFQMKSSMEIISKSSTNGRTRRKSPEFTWSLDISRKFIKLRGEKHTEIYSKGHNAVYLEILEELGISSYISATNARKKWNYLIRKYQDEEMSEGRSRWGLMQDMKSVMKLLGGSDASHVKSRASPEFLWPNELTKKFIALRSSRHRDFADGHNQQRIYTEIMEELHLEHILNANQLRKKWNYLVAKCRELLSVTRSSGGDDEDEESRPPSAAPCSHSWPFFNEMKTALESASTVVDPSSSLQSVDSSKSRIGLKKNPDNINNIWTKDVIIQLIEAKGRLSAEYGASGQKTSLAFSQIVEQLGLTGEVSADQARRKWNYLYAKYLVLSQPEVDEFGRQSWPFYEAMKRTMGTLSASEIINRKNFGIEEDTGGDDEAEGENGGRSTTTISSRRSHAYSCFLCAKTSRSLNEFFMFEEKQLLLHTQQNVMAVLSDLIGKKLFNNESTTTLCAKCTNLANEADSVIAYRRKLENEARKLYSEMLLSRKNNNKNDSKKEPSSFSCCSGKRDDVEDGDVTTGNEDGMDKSEVVFRDGDGEQQRAEAEDLVVTEDDEGRLKRVTYSKRGRKRKSIVRSPQGDDLLAVKSERLEEVDASTEPAVDDSIDAPCEDEGRLWRRCKTRGGSKGSKPLSRGRRRKRGRPAVRSSLIGRGLEEQYSLSNKRKVVPLKSPKLYTCFECNSQFKKYTELVSHRKDAHTLVDLSTLEVNETVLENGLITYFNKDKANNVSMSHPCRTCDKRFLRKDDLWYHEEIAHTDGRGRVKTVFKDRSYECDECGEKFLFKYKLKLHVNNKHLNDAGLSADDFTCGVCGCKLGSLPGLTFHMRKHHNKSLTYQKSAEYLCNDCGFMANSKKKLKDHQSSHCKSSTKPKVQCEICGKTVLKVSLKMHKMKMHLDFKEQCNRCGERYATKTDLLRHINIVHLKILLYACDQCGEKFATSDSLRYHRVKQHEKPSFYCQICGKCYRRVGELNSHIKRTHDDRKKAQVCQFCGKEYFDRSGLRNHLISKHNVPQEMTYSDTYLRKKRVDGLPLAKHFEKRERLQPTTTTTIILQADDPQCNLQQQPQHHQHGPFDGIPPQHHHQLSTTQLHHHQPAPAQNHHNGAAMVGLSTAATTTTADQSHHQMRIIMEEAAEAARNLTATTFHEVQTGSGEESGALVVTEITAGSSHVVDQAVLVDPITVQQSTMMHHPHHSHHQQVGHMIPAQPSMQMMHHQIQHTQAPVPGTGNMRLNLVFPANMQNHVQPHMNM